MSKEETGFPVGFPTEYSPSILVACDNNYQGNFQTISIDAPEFTFLCKKTKVPDYAVLEIIYKPKKSLIETTSLRKYLWSYRNHQNFFEDVCNQIANDLYHLIQPEYLEVKGNLIILGGTTIRPHIILGNKL
jgi:7-cyano-7-deazaguanine reductase